MNDGRWSAWGTSVIGPAHRSGAVPNQDAWMARRLHDGAAVAVSDGLGSCAYAEVGARAACRSVLEAATILFQHKPVALGGMPELVQELWMGRLGSHAPVDCSATCLFVATRREAGAFLAQLGDGLIAACSMDGTVDLMVPDKTESFANLTVGLGSEDAAVLWRTATVPDDRYHAFLLCTDGIAEDLDPSMIEDFALSVHEHYVGYPRRARRREIQSWLRRWPVPGHTDDKTIACIHRMGVGG